MTKFNDNLRLKDELRHTQNKYINLGVEILAAVIIGTAGGYWLDGLLGIRPWLMIGGFFLGTAAGLINVFRAVASEERKS